MNNCVFDGRLARDAELKDLGENKVCNFSVGSNVGFGDKQKTLWLDCSIWGRRGEALNDSLKKGQQVSGWDFVWFLLFFSSIHSLITAA